MAAPHAPGRRPARDRPLAASLVFILAPLSLLAGLDGLGLVTETLIGVLMFPAVLGVAAFTGGALYLATPTLIPILLGFLVWAPQALAEGIKEWYESEPRHESSDDYDSGLSFISENHRRDVEIYGDHRYHRYGYDDD